MLNKKIVLLFVALAIFYIFISEITNSVRTSHLSVTSNEENKIYLRSREFTPSKLTDIVKSDKKHFLIQFENFPTQEEMKVLDDRGIKLLDYIPNKAWFISISGVTPRGVAKLSNIRFIGDILPEDKISPHLRKGDA